MSSSGNKNYPATIDDTKDNIIFENTDSKFHIPENYKRFYIVSKNDFKKYKKDLEAIEKANPILKNEDDKILDFDIYTMDSPKGIKFLKNEIFLKKKYIRSDEYTDRFVYQPEKSVVMNPYNTSAVLNPIDKSALLNSIDKSALLNPQSTSALLNPQSTSALIKPKQNVAIFVKTNTNGGRKSKKSKKIRKHKGIIQTGGNAGRLQKGYKYSGKRLKNGMPEILKVKSVKK
jgi:hypothetical protein